MHIKGLAKLRKLDLRDTKVTDEGVEELEATLPKLYVAH
ncbi:MAG: leucine-rich repeat domain-containing protein [Planctomycetota bacterium]